MNDAARAAFVRAHTILAPVPLVPEIVVYTASEVTPLWRVTEDWLGRHGASLPYWSVPWAGGQALARWLLDDCDAVRGARVLDFACGGGVVAIAAVLAGAASVRAVDVDPLAIAAARLNAEANGVAIALSGDDLVGRELGDVDIVLAGDVWYERDAAARFLPWMRGLVAGGTRVVTGDPGRAYVPTGARELSRYEVPTPTELESAPSRTTRVLDVS